MKKRNLYAALLGLAVASQATAQVYVTETQFFSGGVNDNGEVLISKNQCSPYNIWKPADNINDITEIGGISAGNGIGGQARWTDDGKFVTGVTPWENIAITTGWSNFVFDEPADKPQPHHMNNIFMIASSLIVATASDAEGEDMQIRITTNNGNSWKNRKATVFGDDGYGREQDVAGYMLDGCRATGLNGFMCGRNAEMYSIGSNGNDFHLITPVLNDFESEVDTYTAMDFVAVANYTDTPKYSVIAVLDKEGKNSVWYSTDGGDSYSRADATFSDNITMDFCYTGEGDNVEMWLVTDGGKVMKSNNYGASWNVVFETEDKSALKRIHFADADHGVSVGENAVYVTTDGGENWTECVIGSDDEPGINPLTNTVWNDACWHGTDLFVFGTNGAAYSTQNFGKTWKKEDLGDTEGHDLNRAVLSEDGKYILVAANDFRIYRIGFEDSRFGYLAGKYDVEAGEWTPMECSGVFSQDVNSSCYDVSGDGRVLVGNSQQMFEGRVNVGDEQGRQDASGELLQRGIACAWTDGKLQFLPVKDETSSRSTQAYSVSYDGSVIVGWNDFMGPWCGCYWTRNEDGSYTQHMLLKEGVNEEDIDFYSIENNMKYCFGPAHAVSPNGKWIGGSGTTNNYTLNAWLYNIETGEFKDLGVDGGTVVEVNNDGTKAVGYGASGLSNFYWTEEEGVTSLDQIAYELGLEYTMDNFGMVSCVDASPNWRYFCGWGMAGMGKYAYMIDTKGKTSGIGNEIIEQTKAEVYPNPVSDILHVSLPYEGMGTVITLFDLQGRTVKKVKTDSMSNEIYVNDVKPGLYILDVEAKGLHKGFKITIKH